MRAPPERLAAPGAWWSLAPEALLAALHSSREGLSPREAAQRWRTHGPNTVRADEAPAWPRLLLFAQVVWIYFSGGHNKGAPEWWPQGGYSALANALSDPHFARFDSSFSRNCEAFSTAASRSCV